MIIFLAIIRRTRCSPSGVSPRVLQCGGAGYTGAMLGRQELLEYAAGELITALALDARLVAVVRLRVAVVVARLHVPGSGRSRSGCRSS